MTYDYVRTESVIMPRNPSSGDHLTTAGVAHLLGCTEANVRNLERTGVLVPAHIAKGGVYEMSIYHRYRGGCNGRGTIIEEYMAHLDYEADVLRAWGLKVPAYLERWGKGRNPDGPAQRFLNLGGPS